MTRFWLDPFSVPIEVDGEVMPARSKLILESGLTATDDEENDGTRLALTVGVELEPPVTLTNTDPSEVPFTVRGAAVQAAHLTDWKNSAGTVVAAITATGALLLATLSTGVLHSDGSGNVTSSTIVNADVSASAAIATSKLGQSGATTGQVLAWNGSAWAPSSTVPAADPSTTGGIRLTNDLGGTATSPTVVALTGTANIVTVRGTTIQWLSTVTGPTITQATTTIAAGATLTVQAQAGDGGGDLHLYAGDTSVSDATGGDVHLKAGNGSLGDGDGGSVSIEAGTGNDEDGELSLIVGQSQINLNVAGSNVATLTPATFAITGALVVSGTGSVTGTANVVQLTVRAHSTQTAHLVDFKNTAGTISSYITQDGKIVANASGAACTIQGYATAESTIGVIYLGNNSPSANNYTLLGNTSGNTYLNAATSPLTFLVANSTVALAGTDGDGVFVSVGAGGTFSTAGAVRLANNRYIAARNAAAGGNVNMWKINASDQLQTGVLTTAGHVLTDSSGVISSAVDLVAKNKTADESVTSSTTLQNDDHLVLAILANETWTIRFALYVTYASADGIKIAITLPSGATMLLLAQMVTDSAETTIFQHTTTGGGDVVLQPGEATTESLVIVDVTVVNAGNAGNVQLQFAQNNSSGTATVIKQNSSFVAVRK